MKKYKFDRGSPHPNAVIEIDPAGARIGTPDYPG